MNIQELKEIIKQQEIEIKERKKYLRQDHRLISDVSSKQCDLYLLKCDNRINFILYAFLRGKRYDSQEKLKPTSWFKSCLIYHIKKKLNEDGLQFFKDWIEQTS